MKKKRELLESIDVGKKSKQDKKKNEEYLHEIDTKKDTRKLLILVGAVLGVFIFFFLIKFFYNRTVEYPSYNYNGFEFVKVAGLWRTDWQRGNKIFTIRLRYGPKESEKVPIYFGEDQSFNASEGIYITFEPLDNDLAYIAIAGSEMGLSLSNVFNVGATAACYRNVTEHCHKRPIVTCENTNTPVIFIKSDEETKITLDKKCLTIQGRKEEIIRAADKIIWIWYGIIK